LPPRLESAYAAEKVNVICERAPTWLVLASTMSSSKASATAEMSLALK
jgi:hypothetical protein